MKVRSEEDWRALLSSWHTSGLTKREFCDHHQTSVSAFYIWAKKLGISLEPGTLVPSKIKTAARSLPDFVELDLPNLSDKLNQKESRMIRIITSYGAVLEMPL